MLRNESVIVYRIGIELVDLINIGMRLLMNDIVFSEDLIIKRDIPVNMNVFYQNEVIFI